MNELAYGVPEIGDRKWKAVYTIVENLNKGGGKGDKKYWIRVGVAFLNRDGSLNVRLDAMPVNGTLHIRDQPSAEEQRNRRGDERRNEDHAPEAQKGMAA
jgi:hypothetical protein